MSEEIAHPAETIRERVILFFVFLTAEETSPISPQDLPPDRRAYELCRLWFDEIYTPSTRYLDGIKGDQSEAAVARFRAGFSEDELEALERFHRFLELRVDMLSDEAHERNAFPQGDAWDAIVRHGGYLLDDLAAEPDKLTELLHTLTQRSESSDDLSVKRVLDIVHETLRQNRLTD